MADSQWSERDGHLAVEDDDGDEECTFVTLTVCVDETQRVHTVHLPTDDVGRIADAIRECVHAVGATVPDLGVELARRGL